MRSAPTQRRKGEEGRTITTAPARATASRGWAPNGHAAQLERACAPRESPPDCTEARLHDRRAMRRPPPCARAVAALGRNEMAQKQGTSRQMEDGAGVVTNSGPLLPTSPKPTPESAQRKALPNNVGRRAAQCVSARRRYCPATSASTTHARASGPALQKWHGPSSSGPRRRTRTAQRACWRAQDHEVRLPSCSLPLKASCTTSATMIAELDLRVCKRRVHRNG